MCFKQAAGCLGAVVLISWASHVSRAADDSFLQAELAARRFQMPPGFKLEVVATEPMLANPVAISIDEQGRIFAVETHRFNTGVVDITKHTNWIEADLSLRTVEDRAKFLLENFGANRPVLTRDSERIRLLVDSDGDGRMDQATTFAEEFNGVTSGIGAGIFAQDGVAWGGVIPDLWRYEYKGSQRINATNVATGFGVHIGVTGHDLHGLIMGPDGRMYMSIGDRGFHITNREGKVLDYPHWCCFALRA